MPELPKQQMLSLRERIDQQRNTVEALKRDGHPCPDAERALQQLLTEEARQDLRKA